MNFFSKYKHVISLGSGCHVSMSLNRCRLRKLAYVFDWVWNLDDGLFVVTNAIKDKFEKMSQRENYIKIKHYALPDLDEVIVNKEYPNTAFIHHNLIEDNEVFAAFLRRMKRFLKLLENKNDKVLFIYYREQGTSVKILGKYNKNLDFKNLLIEESIYFIEEIKKIYPDLNFDLLALYAYNEDCLQSFDLPQNRYFGKTSLYFDKLPTLKGVEKKDSENWNENLDEIFYRYGIYADFNIFIKKYKKFTRFLGNIIKNIFKRAH